MSTIERDSPTYFVITQTIQTEHGDVTFMVSSENETSANTLSQLCETSLGQSLREELFSNFPM